MCANIEIMKFDNESKTIVVRGRYDRMIYDEIIPEALEFFGKYSDFEQLNLMISNNMGIILNHDDNLTSACRKWNEGTFIVKFNDDGLLKKSEISSNSKIKEERSK